MIQMLQYIMSKIWTQKDIDFLTANFSTLGLAYCSEHLNRTEYSIRMKASRLGIPAPSIGRRKTHEQYLSDLKSKNIDIIPLQPYETALTKIKHTCINNHEWFVRPNDILNGKGCGLCKDKLKTKTHQEYLRELLENNIPYKPLEDYKLNSEPILHECLNGHIWKVRPNHLLSRGSGCPQCANYQFDADMPTILYYIKIGDYYKIGLTQRSIHKRFYADREKEITIIFEQVFNNLEEAKIAEREFLENHKDKRVHVPGYLKSNGNTELFYEDVCSITAQAS